MLGSEACGFGASICLSVKGFNLPPLGASMAPMDGGRPIASILEGRSARRQACLLLVKSPVVIELLVLRSGTVWHRGTGFQCLNSSACLRACRDLNGVACCFKAERALHGQEEHLGRSSWWSCQIRPTQVLCSTSLPKWPRPWGTLPEDGALPTRKATDLGRLEQRMHTDPRGMPQQMSSLPAVRPSMPPGVTVLVGV